MEARYYKINSVTDEGTDFSSDMFFGGCIFNQVGRTNFGGKRWGGGLRRDVRLSYSAGPAAVIEGAAVSGGSECRQGGCSSRQSRTMQQRGTCSFRYHKKCQRPRQSCVVVQVLLLNQGLPSEPVGIRRPSMSEISRSWQPCAAYFQLGVNLYHPYSSEQPCLLTLAKGFSMAYCSPPPSLPPPLAQPRQYKVELFAVFYRTYVPSSE